MSRDRKLKLIINELSKNATLPDIIIDIIYGILFPATGTEDR